MKTRTRFFSFALTLAMCLGLTSGLGGTALAADDDPWSGIHMETSSYAELLGSYDVIQGNPYNDLVSYTTLENVYAIPEDTTFTVSNTGNAYPIYIYWSCYTMQPPGSELDASVWDDELEDGVYALLDISNEYYGISMATYLSLTPDPWENHIPADNGMYWKFDAYVDSETSDALFLSNGDTITFSVPKDNGVGMDVIYRLLAEYYNEEEDYYYWKYLNFVYSDELSAPAAPVGGFEDVQVKDYCAEPVLWAVENSITKGTSETTFSPDDTCTNGQILTFMWRAMGEPEPGIANPFTDLDSDAYYYKAALWAVQKGIISADQFDPNQQCTRSMTMEYFWKLAGSPETAINGVFTDVAADASYAQAVAWAVEQGITNGTSTTTFSPDETCTRAHIVTFLYRQFAK